MLSDGVANKAEYLDVGCGDLSERVGSELLNADAASRRGCFQPSQDFRRHLNAQRHASSVQISRAEQQGRSDGLGFAV